MPLYTRPLPGSRMRVEGSYGSQARGYKQRALKKMSQRVPSSSGELVQAALHDRLPIEITLGDEDDTSA